MNFIKIIRLSWYFYKGYIFSSLLITGCCVFLFFEYGFDIFTILLLGKIATLGITLVFIESYKINEFYYFKNLGVSKIQLWVSSLIFDFTIFSLLILITNKFR
jgi:hypothetical protein